MIERNMAYTFHTSIFIESLNLKLDERRSGQIVLIMMVVYCVGEA